MKCDLRFILIFEETNVGLFRFWGCWWKFYSDHIKKQITLLI
jgi:hypothetical protein